MEPVLSRAMALIATGLHLGLSMTKTGMTALSTAFISNKSNSLPWMIDKVVSWGSTGIRKLLTVFRWPMFVLALYVGACIAIHVYSPDPDIHTFPASCQESAPSPYLGCNRIEAVIMGPRKKGMVDRVKKKKKNKDDQPLSEKKQKTMRALAGEKTPVEKRLDEVIPASPSSVCGTVEEIGKLAADWVLQSHAFSSILEETRDDDDAGGIFIHARILSTVFGFADDMFIRIEDMGDMDGSSGIKVSAQGQLRIGVSDIGVNARRNKKFIEYLKQSCM